MKVTSLKDVESYIYSTVILPLKGLQIDGLNQSSPIRGDRGRDWKLGLIREDVQGEFAHNYERDDAREQAWWLVTLSDGARTSIIADYDPRRHNVTIFKGSTGSWKGINILLNKLDEAFRRNTPFDKVKVVDDKRSVAVSAETRLGV
jgi:hypothetical protein